MPPGSAHTIALLLHDFYAGGAERVAVTLANAWRVMGRDVTILCGCEAGAFRSRVDSSVQVATVVPPVPQGRFSRIRFGLASIRALRRLQPDIVFAPGNFHLPVIGIAARAQYTPRPAFVCKLSNRLYRPGRSSVGQAVFNTTSRMWAARLDGVIAMSPSLRDEARTMLRDPRVDFIWEPCITCDTFVAAMPAPSRSATRVLVVGRLVPEKNVSLALRTFAEFRRHRTAKLQVLGDGPLRARLELESRTLGIANDVEFVGHVADTRPYFAQASALLSTSRYEGYPAVIIEALAAGVPVVATNSSPALTEMLCDDTFGTVAAAAADALAGALIAVWRERPAAAPLTGLVARHRVHRSAQAYLRFFDRICSTAGRPADRVDQTAPFPPAPMG